MDRIAAELNGRPRPTLDWMNPAEEMAELLDGEAPMPDVATLTPQRSAARFCLIA